MTDWIAKLFEHPDLLKMGHAQRAADHNLGLGWLYYGLARMVRPATAVVIGSYRGFVPLVLARALADNLEGGRVEFLDPSLVDDFWKDAARVAAHFQRFGAANIRHHLTTTQQFAASEAYRALGPVGLLFVDGFHSEEQAAFDFATFAPKLTADAVVLFHDSVTVRLSKFYGPGREYEHRVKCFMDRLKQDANLQVMDWPLASGVTVVRKATPEAPWTCPPVGRDAP